MPDYTDFATFTDYRIFDADQHLAEASDCYSRHIPKQYTDRTIRLEMGPEGETIGFAQDRRIMQDNDLAKCNRSRLSEGPSEELQKGLRRQQPV